MRTTLIFIGWGLITAGSSMAAAETSEIEMLRNEMAEMRRSYETRMEALEARLKSAEEKAGSAAAAVREAPAPQPAAKEQPPSRTEALDAALAEAESAAPAGAPSERTPGDIWSRQMGGATVRLIDVSLDILAAAGGSSAKSDEIPLLEGGAHDPKRNGFTLQQAELGLRGAVDPYFTAEAYVTASEDEVELEEAYFTSTSLPYGLQLKGGYFLTEYGINNPTHPHAWEWIDQPVINTRLFSGEGQRAAGTRLAALLPAPWFSEFEIGVQDPQGTAISFLGEDHEHGDEPEEPEPFAGELTIGGFARVKEDVTSASDLLYLARWVNAWEFNETTSARLGFSGLFGPNATGGDGRTYIYGTDLRVKWRPEDSFRGWPFLIWTTEISRRQFDVDTSNPLFEPGVTADELIDWGLYSELDYGFHPGWAAGFRVEYAGGSGNGPVPRNEDPFRDNRWRLSPLLTWYTSEFSRFRLQYNFDAADFLADGHASSVWLGAEVLIGSHPAHKF